MTQDLRVRWYIAAYTLLMMAIYTYFFLIPLFPPNNTLFYGHDITQSARILSLRAALARLELPPIFAQEWNHGVGYPLFLFYAPSAYFITLFTGIQWSFALALAVGAYGAYQLTRPYTSHIPALIAGFAFASNIYFATDIFVRFNLAETWFVAILPLALATYNPFAIALALTTHNGLSLLAVPIFGMHALSTKKIKKAYFRIMAGVLISCIFWIPALVHMPQTQATHLARMTDYRDHFLCPIQIWRSPWGFGGSVVGCTADGISFMIGKILLVGGLGGLLVNRKWWYTIYAIAPLWLTTYYAQYIWHIFSFLAVLQFPWRLLAFSLPYLALGVGLGIHWLSNQIVQHIPLLHVCHRRIYVVQGLLGALCVMCIVTLQAKYFQGQLLTRNIYNASYTSPAFVSQKAAYYVQEYIPKSVPYTWWKSFEGKSMNQKQKTALRNYMSMFHVHRWTQVAGAIAGLSGILLSIHVTRGPRCS